MPSCAGLARARSDILHSVFLGSKATFRAGRTGGRWGIAALSVGIACVVAACGDSSSSVPKASIATTLAAGSAALRQRDYWAAEQLFLQVTKRDPGNFVAYYNLGVAYQAQHDIHGA